MEVKQLLAMVLDGAKDKPTVRRAAFLKQLEAGSVYLEEHREDIVGLWDRTTEVQILSFYETKDTPSLVKVSHL